MPLDSETWAATAVERVATVDAGAGVEHWAAAARVVFRAEVAVHQGAEAAEEVTVVVATAECAGWEAALVARWAAVAPTGAAAPMAVQTR